MDFKAYKMDGLGNDFVIIDQREKKYDLNNSQIKKICDRGNIGCDQLILINKSDKFDAFLTFKNSDGSDSAACGNGTRCVASLLSKENSKNFCFRDNKGSLSLPLPALVGTHQVHNASIAVAVLRHLGISSSSVLKKSMRNVVWPGRMQRIDSGLLIEIANNLEVWLDGGHNAAAGQALAEVLKSLPPMKTILISGGGGYLGTELSQKLLNNFKVIIFDKFYFPWILKNKNKIKNNQNLKILKKKKIKN